MEQLRTLFIVGGIVSFAGSSLAQIVVDGTAEANYGAPLSIQNTQTGFGDSNLGQIDFANGSELDQGFGYMDASNLYLVFAGNLESNFNKLDIFVDSKSGGQNRLRGDNPNVDFNGLNRMGDDGSGNGLKFDSGFEADYYLTMGGGNSPYQLFANYAELRNGGVGRYLGQGGAGTNGTLTGGDNPDNILCTINNSNVAGVTGGNGVSSGAGVFTGVEWRISLAALGNPTGPINISAFINGGGHDFVSNQVLAGIGGGNNLGEPRNVDFSGIAGNQYFTVAPVPEPATLAALALGLGALLLKRRRI